MNETQQDPSEDQPKPVDDPNLPAEGDQEDFDETPVSDEEVQTGGEVDDAQGPEEPNDLSGIDKEFDDDDEKEESGDSEESQDDSSDDSPPVDAPEVPEAPVETPVEDPDRTTAPNPAADNQEGS